MKKIEITEKEYEEMKAFYDDYLFGTCPETPRKKVWDNMIRRIEAERKPKGYLEKKVRQWEEHTGMPLTKAGIVHILGAIKTDIARIFDEEIAKAGKRYFIGETGEELLASLKHKVCGEQE